MISCETLFSSIIYRPESLFSGSASNERKYWGFVIVQRVMPRIKAADLPMLFTKNFMRTWINHLSHFDRYLHSFAKQIASLDASYPLSSVYADCQESQAKEIVSVVHKDPTFGFAFILQLTGVHGSQQFDKLTKTSTVESILTRMSAEGIKNYISHLLGQANASPASRQCASNPFKIVDNSLRTRSDNQVIDARRSWVIEQFAALIHKGTIPKSDEWVQVILEWFIVHGIFTIKRKSQKSSISAVCIPPSSSGSGFFNWARRSILCRRHRTRTTYGANAASVYSAVWLISPSCQLSLRRVRRYRGSLALPRMASSGSQEWWK